jgi:nicotinate-nucleotide pyrophosphorylase (carboxylating)
VVAVPPHPPLATWGPLVERALLEDVGHGDVTSALVLPPEATLRAVIEAREPLVVCGLRVAAHAFALLEPALEVRPASRDGDAAAPGDVLLALSGPARPVLAGERTALNLLSRTCGVASFTRRFVERLAGTATRVVDTRKTLPGWRVLDKYAVAVGGGVNHRAGLFDAILIKDNHIAAAGGVGPAVKAARAGAPPHLWLQVEVESEAAAEEALEAGADALLLDNRSVDEVRALVARFGERTVLEASGGIRLENVRAYAETGVHRVSLGALTHSAPGADVALEVVASTP